MRALRLRARPCTVLQCTMYSARHVLGAETKAGLDALARLHVRELRHSFASALDDSATLPRARPYPDSRSTLRPFSPRRHCRAGRAFLVTY